MRDTSRAWFFSFQLLLVVCLLLSGAALVHAQQVPSPGTAAGQSGGSEERDLAQSFLSTYKLGPGDVITIRVFGEDELSLGRTRLTDSGTVFMPALGEILIRDKSMGEVERMVADGLRGRFLVNPQVSVTVEEYRPFFISGMVARPGAYPYQPGLTTRRAATIAGGFKERASMSRITVIRGDDPTQASRKLELNDPVYPGDTVTVGESFF